MDRFTQYAVVSAVQAVADSGIDFEAEDKHRVGVLVGTGIGGLKEIEDQHKRILSKGPRKVSPFCVPRLMGNAASGCISILYGLKGPNMCIVTACASASHSIGEAFYREIPVGILREVRKRLSRRLWEKTVEFYRRHGIAEIIKQIDT